MRKTSLNAGLHASLALSLVLGASTARAADAPCDRACLEGFVNQYLDAMIAHDPGRLPLAPNARCTENGQTLKLGDGMWGPANKIDAYKIYFADPQAGQVGYMGVVEENGHPENIALRLKIVNRQISEMEAIVARNSGATGPNTRPKNGLFDKPIFRESLKPGEGRPRDEMIRIANSYFEGLEQATDAVTPFDPNCQRVENGTITANDPNATGIGKMSCGAQFATGFSPFITHVRERRFPIVDEERGLVYAILFFDHAGKITSVKWTDGVTHKVGFPFDTPYCFMIGELFKIQNGKIMRVEAVLLPVPYGMKSGWAPDLN